MYRDVVVVVGGFKNHLKTPYSNGYPCGKPAILGYINQSEALQLHY